MRRVSIVGTGQTKVGRLNRTADNLAQEAIHSALADARLSLKDLDGIVALPSLSENHFMAAHYLATQIGLFKHHKHQAPLLRTVDVGGAGPVAALFTAQQLLRSDQANTIAVVASDAVLSLSGKEFLKRANGAVDGPHNLPSPAIPNGYDRCLEYTLKHQKSSSSTTTTPLGGITRKRMAMIPVIHSYLAVKHPDAMCKVPLTLQEVLDSPKVAPHTNLLECARRADGAAAVIVASEGTYNRRPESEKKPIEKQVRIVSVGEASGPLYPPPVEEMGEWYFSSERAAKLAYRAANLTPADIDIASLYDCFPICFARSLVSCGFVSSERVGDYIEQVYNKTIATGRVDTELFPFNTHGGLSQFAAPWEAPALYGVCEMVAQLTGDAKERQIRIPTKNGTTRLPSRALAYANGGIFSASAVAILAADTEMMMEGAKF